MFLTLFCCSSPSNNRQSIISSCCTHCTVSQWMYTCALLLQEARTLAVNNVEHGQWHGATPGLPVVYFAAAETQAPSVPVMSADVIKLPKA